MIKFWTIAYKERGDSNLYPVYEGNDGRYYLGGSPSTCKPLLFQTKKSAEPKLKQVKEIEESAKEGRTWVDNGSFSISRCYIEI